MMNPRVEVEQSGRAYLRWTSDPYQGHRLYIDGVPVTRTFEVGVDEIGLGKLDGKTHEYKLEPLDAYGVVGPAETVTYPPVEPPPPPPPPDNVIEAWPGEALTKIAAAKAGDIVMFRGDHPRLMIAQDGLDGVTLSCADDGVVRGVTTNGGSTYLFDGMRIDIPPELWDSDVGAFYVNGGSNDIKLFRSVVSGGYVTVKVYNAGTGLHLEECDLSGGGEDIMHIDGATDVVIGRDGPTPCVFRDPTMGNPDAHHDGIQAQEWDGLHIGPYTYVTWPAAVPKDYPDQAMFLNRNGAVPARGLILDRPQCIDYKGGRGPQILNVEGEAHIRHPVISGCGASNSPELTIGGEGIKHLYGVADQYPDVYVTANAVFHPESDWPF